MGGNGGNGREWVGMGGNGREIAGFGGDLGGVEVCTYKTLG
jgi:hypothetical protein